MDPVFIERTRQGCKLDASGWIVRFHGEVATSNLCDSCFVCIFHSPRWHDTRAILQIALALWVGILSARVEPTISCFMPSQDSKLVTTELSSASGPHQVGRKTEISAPRLGYESPIEKLSLASVIAVLVPISESVSMLTNACGCATNYWQQP
jgi:hypothetical protein